MARRDDARTVYRSGQGRVCPHCGHPTKRCQCRASPRTTSGDGIVRVRREVKGRRGRTVTTVAGVPLATDGLRNLAQELKRRCGSGGSVKDGVIEIQGDHAEVLVAELEGRGYRLRQARGAVPLELPAPSTQPVFWPTPRISSRRLSSPSLGCSLRSGWSTP